MTDTTMGYSALVEGLAVFELERVLFEFSGRAAVRVVNGLVTNSIEATQDGRGAYAFALTAKGRPIGEMRVLPVPDPSPAETEEERLWLDVPVAAAEGLRDLFARTVPPIFATVDEPSIRRISVTGADPRAIEAALGAIGLDGGVLDSLDTRVTVLREVDGRDVALLLVGRETIEGPGIDVYVPAGVGDLLLELLSAAVLERGGAVASPEDWNVVRVERGVPEYGREIMTDNLAQETGQTDRAISFDKGCYTGQEVVARLHYRGHVNRVLRGLRPSDAELELREGASLYRAGREIGSILTVVSSPRFGTLGLGYVRTAAEPGEEVSLDPGSESGVSICELPFT